jgi:hypothetical protein
MHGTISRRHGPAPDIHNNASFILSVILMTGT